VNAPYGIMEASNDILQLDQERWEKLAASGPGGVDVILSGGPASCEAKQPAAERVRFVLRFARMFYQWIVVDFGRLNPFSARVAGEVSRLHLVATCDILGLNEAKLAAEALLQAGFDRDRLALILNQAPARQWFSEGDLEDLLGVPVEAMLPERHQDFADSFQHGKRLGESRKFQKHVAQLAAEIAGLEKQAPAANSRLPFLIGAFRDATARN
jgi:Flp pilus assembly CpaE family ATPase